MKILSALLLTCLLAIPAKAQTAAKPTPGKKAPSPARMDELPIVAAPPGVMIDFYPVTTSAQKGGRFINTRDLPKLGHIAAAPALQVERVRSVKKTNKTIQKTVETADGRKRTVSNTVPAIEMVLLRADAEAFEDLMKKSVGQHIYIEAQGAPIYAPLVREALSATTLSFSLGDDAQREEVYSKLAPFVKK